MADRFDSLLAGLESPASDAFSITPTDGVDLSDVTRGLYVGGAGDVAVRMVAGTTLTFPGVQAGSVLPLRVDRVLSTGTTASNIIGLL